MGKSKNKNELDSVIDIEIVTREEWGAVLPTKTPKLLKTPVKYIRYSYSNTKEENCVSLETCCQDVRLFQEQLMKVGYPDLPYNFLIGYDGRVYEGNGWYLDVKKHKSYKKFRRKCLEITYMGEFARFLPPPHMVDVAAAFVKLGVQLNLIQSVPRVETLNDFRDYMYYEDQIR